MARLLQQAGLPPAVFQHSIHTREGRFLAQVVHQPEYVAAVIGRTLAALAA
jgi:hypothetical protein